MTVLLLLGNKTTDDILPTGTTGDLKQLTLRVRVDAAAVTGADASVGTSTVAGSPMGVASDIYEFVLVKTLPETDAPTLAITHTPADGTAVGADGMVDVYLHIYEMFQVLPLQAMVHSLLRTSPLKGGTEGTLSDPTVTDVTLGTGDTATMTKDNCLYVESQTGYDVYRCDSVSCSRKCHRCSTRSK